MTTAQIFYDLIAPLKPLEAVVTFAPMAPAICAWPLTRRGPRFSNLFPWIEDLKDVEMSHFTLSFLIWDNNFQYFPWALHRSFQCFCFPIFLGGNDYNIHSFIWFHSFKGLLFNIQNSSPNSGTPRLAASVEQSQEAAGVGLYRDHPGTPKTKHCFTWQRFSWMVNQTFTWNMVRNHQTSIKKLVVDGTRINYQVCLGGNQIMQMYGNFAWCPSSSAWFWVGNITRPVWWFFRIPGCNHHQASQRVFRDERTTATDILRGWDKPIALGI